MSEKEQLGLHNLPAPKGARSPKKRKGRGPGSGQGKTAGRGHKGQRARSGGRVPAYFEGGQMPLIRRIPKRGFTNPARVEYQVVNLKDLSKVGDANIDPTSLHAASLIGHEKRPVKILGTGDADKAYVISGCKISAAAKAKIEKAGGKVED